MLDTVAPDRVHSTEPAGVGARWYARPLVSALVLTAALMVIGQFMDPAGYLSTDVGGKVATLEAMSDANTISPDIGYWAESVDPDGSLYPMFSTQRVGDSWVNVTTLPMLYLALPFYEMGGVRLALLIPVLGTMFAALAGRALALRLGGRASHGTLAFWAIGLASPATIYGLSIWEHSLSLALMAWAVVATLDATGLVTSGSDASSSQWRSAALAGLAFGLAASMRQEALVYGFVAGVALVVTIVRSGRFLSAMSAGCAMAAAALTGLVANGMLELASMGTTFRSGRAASTAASAGGGGVDMAVRFKEAIVTGSGLSTTRSIPAYLTAFGLLALLVLLGRRADEPFEKVRPILIGLAALMLITVVDFGVSGLGFVPGLLATTPIAGLALTRGWVRGPRSFVMSIAIAALPLVWLTQFTGGAGPQWGGRYILTSGLLLAVVAIVSLESVEAVRVGRFVVAAGLVIAVAGLAWSSERSSSFASASAELAARPEQVLVFEDPFIAREAGPLALEGRWLAAPREADRIEAMGLLVSVGVEEFGFVEVSDSSDLIAFPGWVLIGVEEIDLVGTDRLRITTWKRSL